MNKERHTKELRDQYRYLGFTPSRTVEMANGDEDARVLCLTRRSKKQSAAAVRQYIAGGMIADHGEYAICRAVQRAYFFSSMCAA